MTMEEAQEILQEIKHYLTAGNPVWDMDEIAEACDMAIEALSKITTTNSALTAEQGCLERMVKHEPI